MGHWIASLCLEDDFGEVNRGLLLKKGWMATTEGIRLEAVRAEVTEFDGQEGNS